MSHITPISDIGVVKSTVLSNAPWYVNQYPSQSEEIVNIGWTWVQSQPITSFKKKNRNKEAFKNCKQYVKENYKNNQSKTFFGGIILSLILNAIISWIVRKLLDSLFKTNAT